MKEIQITKGQETLVDDHDWEWLRLFKWHYLQCGYVGGKKRGKEIYLHRLIMGAKRGEEVDHRDRNPLNNQRDNLRLVTSQQNKMNKKRHCNGSSRFKGVSWDKARNKWQWRIKAGDTLIRGLVNTEEAAARLYDYHARLLHGEFAVLNFTA